MTHHRKKYKRSLCISGSNERGVSILAPLRGATVGLLILAAVGMFQSTHPCGVRLVDELMRTQNRSVSIHAPLRGATTTLSRASARPKSFNPRTPAGCDLAISRMPSARAAFQSTHPCGVRHVNLMRFQPVPEVSIHAPLRGATLDHYNRRPLAHSFNPRTPAGCDGTSMLWT